MAMLFVIAGCIWLVSAILLYLFIRWIIDETQIWTTRDRMGAIITSCLFSLPGLLLVCAWWLYPDEDKPARW